MIWFLFLLFQRNRPEGVGLPPIEQYHGESETVIDVKEKPAQEHEGTWNVMSAVLRNQMVWYLGAVYFLVKPTRYLLLFWSPVYIAERMGTEHAAIRVVEQHV